jgi:hypothetical protein
MDTGVDMNHPDLVDKWRGGTNSWYDPHGIYENPFDNDGHGTGVMGIMVGGSAGGSAIGVAPNAQWIAVKLFDDAGLALESDIHLGFQWLLDPDGNPDTDDAPDVVNNSWGLEQVPDQCIENVLFRDDIQILKQAGIAVVFAAGNEGPDPATSISPANYPEGFAVGAINESLDIFQQFENFSSRGPSTCDGSIYPQVIAPGVRVRTADLTIFSVPYFNWSGTSFAAPHAAGAMALLMGAFPDVTVSDLESALQESAVDLGVAGPDNDHGHGFIDVLEAYYLLIDSVSIHTATYDAAADKLVVRATSDALPAGSETLILAVQSGGATVKTVTMSYKAASGYYQRVLFGLAATPPDAVTVTSGGGGSDSVTLPFPPPDTAAVTLATYDAAADKLVVRATTDALPAGSQTLTLAVQSGGATVKTVAMSYKAASGYYQKVLFGLAATLPDAVTVTSSGGGADSVTVPFPAPDTVAVTLASYDAAADKLVVRATTDALPAGSQTLTLAVQSGGATVKAVAMSYKAASGYYQKVLFGLAATPPDAVTVTSGGGGSDSATLPYP